MTHLGHFLLNKEMKLEEFFIKHKLPLRGQTVVIAVSGGPDSMALTKMFQDLQAKIPFSLVLAHFDHQLRPDSDQETRMLNHYCQQNHLLLFKGRWPKKEQPTTGLEAAAREARYAFLTKVARQSQATYLVTAHQNDDLIENILLKFIRSGNPDEMNSLPAVSAREDFLLLRPLLSWSKRDLLNYDQQQDLPFIQDASNLTDLTLRNRVRHHFVPLLKKENPAIGRNALRYCREEKLQRQLAQGKIAEVGQPQAFLGGSYRQLATRLAPFSSEEQHYYWRRFIWHHWQRRVNAHLGSFRLLPYQGYIYLLPEQRPVERTRFNIRCDQPFVFQQQQFVLSRKSQAAPARLVGSFWSEQTAFIAGNLQAGEKLPLANGQLVKAKKMFAQAKIPGPLRGCCLVIYDRKGRPLWIQNTYQDQSWYPRGKEYQIYFLKKTKRS